MPQTNISPSLEDYLEAILRIMEKNERVGVTDLSAELNVAKSSVHQAIHKLMDLGLVSHERYGPLKFTVAGRKKAETVKNRHALLKKFLIDILEVDNAIAEKDACNLEHHISAVTIEKLIAFLEKEIE